MTTARRHLRPAAPKSATDLEALRRSLSTVKVGARAEPPKWIIPNFLDEADTTVLYGTWGSGKSLVALDIALSLATGIPALGHEDFRRPPEPPMRVLYIASEGLRGLQNRVTAWAMHRTPDDDPEEEERVAKAIEQNFALWAETDEKGRTYPKPFTLNLSGTQEALEGYEAVYRLVEEGAFDIAIVDTLADFTAGADENSAAKGDAIRRARAIPCPVILVDHAGKDPTLGQRGHSSAPAAADNLIYVSSKVTRKDKNGRPRRTTVTLTDTLSGGRTKRREGVYFGKLSVEVGASMRPWGWPADQTTAPVILRPSALVDPGDIDLTDTQRETIDALGGLGGKKVTRTALQKKLGLNSRQAAKKRLESLIELGLVATEDVEGNNGATLYKLTDLGWAHEQQGDADEQGGGATWLAELTLGDLLEMAAEEARS